MFCRFLKPKTFSFWRFIFIVSYFIFVFLVVFCFTTFKVALITHPLFPRIFKSVYKMVSVPCVSTDVNFKSWINAMVVFMVRFDVMCSFTVALCFWHEKKTTHGISSAFFLWLYREKHVPFDASPFFSPNDHFKVSLEPKGVVPEKFHFVLICLFLLLISTGQPNSKEVWEKKMPNTFNPSSVSRGTASPLLIMNVQ